MLEEKRRDSAPKAKQNGQRNGRGKASANQGNGTLYDAAALQQVSEAEREWESGPVAQATARMPERTASVTTQSGMPIKRLYTPEDSANLDFMRDLGFPGEYPYTRGVQPTMYRAKPWTMRMFAGFGTAEETNARFKYLLEQGQTGLSIAFDMATLYGYDHDHPMALGEFGKCGVAVSSLADMEILFEDIPLDQGHHLDDDQQPGGGDLGDVHRGGGEAGRSDGEARRHAAERHPEGIHRAERVPLPAGAVDAAGGGHHRVRHARDAATGTRSRISGYHIREAGATAVQELAFTLADGLAYVDAAIERGLDDGRVRAAPLVLLQRPQRLLRGDRQVPRRAAHLGARDARALRRARTRARGRCASTRRRRASR